MNDNDLTLLLAILGVALAVVDLITTILLAAFGPIGGLIVAAFVAGGVIAAALMWRFHRRAPP